MWKSEIETSLNSARIVIVVIGKLWLSISDENNRRRIDLEEDWVRREIETSLQTGKKILPLLIDNISSLSSDALPSPIRDLVEIQARQIHDGDTQKHINEIAIEIAGFLGKQIDNTVPMPFPGLIGKIDPLDEINLRRLTQSLPGWKLVPRQRNNDQTIELKRTYMFDTFEDVIHFMNTASRFISQYDHHPEWIFIEH